MQEVFDTHTKVCFWRWVDGTAIYEIANRVVKTHTKGCRFGDYF